MKCTQGNHKGISIGIPHTINATSCTQTCLALEVHTDGNYEDTSIGIPHTQSVVQEMHTKENHENI